MLNYLIGIDSGGTHYRVEAATVDGKVLGYYDGKPASHVYLPTERLIAQINQNIDGCLRQFGGKREDCAYIVCGTTGLDSKADAEYLNHLYASLDGFRCPVHVINDAELAHYTVLGTYGILLISGTGSIAFGKTSRGREFRTGGWSFSIQGDEGSGAWISRMTLMEIGRYLDGAIEESSFLRAAMKMAQVRSREDLVRISNNECMSPSRVPRLSETVNEAARKGDSLASWILDCCTDKLFALLQDAVAIWNHEDEKLRIGLWGSNIVKSDYIREGFMRRVHETYPDAETYLPEKDGVKGALLLAGERLLQGG